MIKAGPLVAALLIVVLLLTITPACAKKPPMMPLFQPLAADPSSRTALAEGKLTLFGTLDLGLQPLDRETRNRYLKEVAGQTADPFGSPVAGQPDPFLVFLFSINNRGTEPVLISPAFAALMDPKRKVTLSPLDSRELAGILATHPAFTPQVSRRVHEATINVNPGQQVARLLVFPAMDRKPKMVEVVFPSVISGTLSGDAPFPFSVTWKPIAEF